MDSSSFLHSKNKKLYNYRIIKTSKTVSDKTLMKNNILFKKKLKNYSGLRHKMKLPVRGQRTKTNAKTCMLSKKLKK